MPKSNSSALPRWCAVFALLISGCASTPTPPAIEEDGKGLWRRVETEHFVVESNQESEQDSCRIARDFETLWKAFAKVPILGLRPPSAKPLIVVLRSDSEFHYLAGDKLAGYFVQKSVLGPVIVMPPNGGLFAETVVKHELAHFVSSDFLPSPPKWLGEGLATVMETASYDTRAGEIVFGAHSASRVDGARSTLPAEKFMAVWPEQMTLLDTHYHYGRSWLLVHYLIDHELQPFLNFLVRVSKGEEWRMAWQREQLPRFDELDERLESYHDGARYGMWKVIARPPPVNSYEATLVSSSDALSLRAVLLAYSPTPHRERTQSIEEAERDLQSALAVDAQNERARRVVAGLQKAKE